jgi:cardiolipin synthase
MFYRADIIASLKSDYETSLEQCRQRSLADINNGLKYIRKSWHKKNSGNEEE